MDHPTLVERQALCAQQVTLNGLPAKITGYRQPFAKVTQISTGLGDEWSWEAVRLVCATSRNFVS